MKNLLLILGILLFINTVYLGVVSNPHLAHALQLGVALFLVVYAFLLEKLPRWVNRSIGLMSLIPLSMMLFLASFGNRAGVDFQEEVAIVLGAGLNKDQVTPHLAERLNTALLFAKQNPNAYLIVSGGLGERQLITEAEAMKRYLVDRGVPAARIIQEEASASTYENLVFSQQILQEKFPEEVRIALITNDFHIYRALSLAHDLGLNAYPLGAPTPWNAWLLNYLRESVAVFNLFLTRISGGNT